MTYKTRTSCTNETQVLTSAKKNLKILVNNNKKRSSSVLVSKSKRTKHQPKLIEIPPTKSEVDKSSVQETYTTEDIPFDLLNIELYSYSDIVQFLSADEMRSMNEAAIDYTPASTCGQELVKIAVGPPSPFILSNTDIFESEIFEILQEYLKYELRRKDINTNEKIRSGPTVDLFYDHNYCVYR